MKRLLVAFALVATTLTLAAPSAGAAFGLNGFDVTFTNADDTPATQAGSHPFEMTTSFKVNTKSDPIWTEVPDGDVKDLTLEQIAGMVGNPTATPRCSTVDFVTPIHPVAFSSCPDSTAVGISEVGANGPGGIFIQPVYNLVPPPGIAARIGFIVGPNAVPVTVDIGVKDTYPYNISAHITNTPQPVPFYGAVTTLWGNPADPVHDGDRGRCGEPHAPQEKTCPTNAPEKPFLTLPRSCEGPLESTYEATSWQNGATDSGSVLTHDDSTPPIPQGMNGCAKLGFGPKIAAKPTTLAAESPTGLDVDLTVQDEGISSPDGYADSDIRKVVVTLPEGMTANPSSAEGLETCSEEQLAKESAAFNAGVGCPDAAKLGSLEVETPILEDRTLRGSLYLAEPYENPFGTLLALYMVIRDPELGVIVRQAVKVEPDPKTGQLIATTDQIPQFPLSRFTLHFREGARSPLVSPPTCGTHTTKAVLTPWAGGAPITSTSTFQIQTGPGAGPCPQGTPPFQPGFEAGTESNQAGSHSPFLMRLTRRDGDQDLTRFSASLPPGMVAKLAGAEQCPEAAIAQARARTGQGGGALELASPSCPASSQIGTVQAGAGVGSVLTYVPGRVYLAGPFNGAPLSAVGVVPAVAGPFDVGTVVTRFALRINPRTTKVEIDGAASDPIPHILAGIPLKVRDIRAYVDRPEFTLNPTSCDPFAVDGLLWGGGTDAFSSSDDSPLARSQRYQAAGCGSLGFQPRLSLKLKGGTRRGAHPALRGEYRPRPGDANLEGLVLRLPSSAFLEQAHIRTICTRVQFAAKSCPPGAIYGKATAWTPLLAQPLSGPVYLRASSNPLPDFVADLKGLIDVEAVARIDSKNGGIRATFTDVPDAPLTKVVVEMQGAKKGLIVNSTDLCAKKQRSNATFAAHNGKRAAGKPVMRVKCGKGRKGKGR